MTSSHRTALMGGLVCFALLGTTARAQDPRPLLQPERMDQPPAPFDPRDDPTARSFATVVTVGPYTSRQVNVDGNGMNIVGDAANEPSIAVNPTDPDNIVIGWRQFDSIASSFREAGWSYTFDKGVTWTFPGVLEDGVFRSDPVLAFDAAGDVYYQSLQDTFLMQLFKSTNGGMSWQAPVQMFGGDKNWLAIDNTGGIGDGNIYGTWQRFFGCCDPDQFTRSTNDGVSFETPVFVDLAPLFGTMDVGPGGEVYIAGIEGTFGQDFDTIAISVSTDAQNASATPTFTGTIVDMGGSMALGGGPNPSGLLGQIAVAADDSAGPGNGNVYLVGTIDPAPLFGGLDATEVRFSRSTDGGATWSPSVRVHDDAPGAGSFHWFGALDVAPNGRIDVIWYDTRNGGGAENLSEVFYSYSYDQGDTWAPNVVVSPQFDSFLGWPQQQKLGDYITIISDATGADIAYAATFNGEQDVYYLRVFPDCNGNGISDVTDIAIGAAFDCNGNDVPDPCDASLGLAADVDRNGIPDPCEADWTDLGNALAGFAGEPLLLGSGLLGGADPTALFLTDARPVTVAALVLGLSTINAPFKGGVLVPATDAIVFGLPTGAGSLDVAFPWPDPAPSGLEVFFQYWITDAAGPFGFAASNAVEASTP